MTGYSAAHDDEQAPSPAIIPPQSQLLVHDCARWPHPQILALGEKCQHCGQTAGQYAPGIELVAGGKKYNIPQGFNSVSYSPETGVIVDGVKWQEVE